MAEINDLTIVDSSNTARFPENMAPSAVNDGARALEGILARFHRDLGGSVLTTGTSTAYVYAANQTLSAYYDGLILGVDFHTACGASPTINVDSLGAKSLVWPDGTALAADDISTGSKAIISYDGTNFQVLTRAIINRIVSTDAGASAGPVWELYRNSVSPAINDLIGAILFAGNDDGGNKTSYVQIVSQIQDETDATEDALLLFKLMRGGSLNTKLILGSGLYSPNATGGDQGVDTANFSALYINGVAVSAGSDLVQVLDADPTENEVVNTVTETNLYSFSVPANTLGTDKTVRLSLRGDYLNDSGAGRTLQVKVKFGATTLYDDTTAAITANAVRRAWALDLMMSAVDSASAQVVNGTFTMSSVGPATTGTGQIDQNNAADGTIQGTSAEDSTGALTFAVTVTHATASASLSIRRKQAVLELLP